MAEQDEPQAGKPEPRLAQTADSSAGSAVLAAEPATVPAKAKAKAKAEAMPLSAAAAAAAAKIEATIAASRAAAAAKGSAAPVLSVPEVEPVDEPVEHQLPATVPAAPNPAISAAAAAASNLAATAAPATKGAPADDRPEIDDFIARIPVEPLPAPTAATPADPAAKAPETRALPTPESADPAAANAAMTAAAVAEARNRVFGAYTPIPEPTRAARERRAAREAALGAKPPLARTLQVLLAAAYPLVLLILAIRLIASPVFLWIAYQRPGFPADGFGFSTSDRLLYGSYGVDYLNNFADSRYLGELRDPLGNPLFLNTEVQHMLDVKNVISTTYLAGLLLAALVVVALVYLGKRYAGGIRRGLFAGAVATLALFAVLGTLAVLGWESFFTGFHKIFFANGTWTFNYSDTLIRLYPPQFWVDAAIAIAVLVALTSVITLIATWPTAKRREASRLRQDARVFGLK
ncbi:TIGR01906 family membrane protein [Paeniglutamicibacter sp. NPDC091659]|uniref:TIGR01906 family membrane protein n=1 Tax=Paeniglutamicibacter sp. NPDC091659 TaxID=3364389 RepID=UPI0038240E72